MAKIRYHGRKITYNAGPNDKLIGQKTSLLDVRLVIAAGFIGLAATVLIILYFLVTRV